MTAAADLARTLPELSTIPIDLPHWACTDKNEEQRLREMKFLLRNEIDELLASFVTVGDKRLALVDAFPDVYSDFRLLRFLRKDSIHNPACAAERYKSFLQWRKDTNADEKRISIEQNPFIAPDHLRVVHDFIPCDFDRPEQLDMATISMILNVGCWDSAGITKKILGSGGQQLSSEDFLDYWTYMFDSLTLKLHNESMERQTMVFVDQICDLKGMNMRQFSPHFMSSIMKPWLKMTQANYPETAKRIFFLNPPPILSLVWKIVAPLTSPGTVAKVQFIKDFEGSGEDFVDQQQRLR